MSTASNGSVLTLGVPAFTMLLAVLMLGEKMTRLRLAGAMPSSPRIANRASSKPMASRREACA